VARYKISSNKSVDLIYQKNKWAEKEIREMTTFTIVTNNIKYLGVTLNKQVKGLYCGPEAFHGDLWPGLVPGFW
jgi:hypothetical protein